MRRTRGERESTGVCKKQNGKKRSAAGVATAKKKKFFLFFTAKAWATSHRYHEFRLLASSHEDVEFSTLADIKVVTRFALGNDGLSIFDFHFVHRIDKLRNLGIVEFGKEDILLHRSSNQRALSSSFITFLPRNGAGCCLLWELFRTFFFFF